MPVLGCGAEMAKLMDVSDQDVATMEDVIKERTALGISQAVAQRHAVDEALAQLAEERSAVMKAVQEQLGFDPAQKTDPAIVASNKPDVSPIGFYSALARG
ncbi:MAG: hypothetical protein CGW95_15030 [Phenylobacterium zucineum]|nr:MAG: hypothetical protein CGW95_15030 [Phenylobacterium zucineum]